MTTRRILLVIAMCAATLASRSIVAGAQEGDVRNAEVVSSSGQPLDEGGGDTLFSLRLPDSAECPGDSAFEAWRINSFMVPRGVDFTALDYDVVGPLPFGVGPGGDFRQPLYEEGTASYAGALTAAVEKAGDPGPVTNVPVFSLRVYEPGDIPAGTYDIGIACTHPDGRTGPVWKSALVITEDPADQPLGLRWNVEAAPSESDGSSPVTRLLVVAGLLTIGLTIHRQRSRRVAATSKS